MRIDVHAHYYTQDLMEGMTRFGVGWGGGLSAPGARITWDERLGMMDDAGIDVQVLSVGAQQPYQEDAQNAAGAARFANDSYREVVERARGRYAAFGCVPLPHVDEALKEATRCLDQLGFSGINLGCSILGRGPDDPAFEPFWAEMDRRRTMVFFHPLGLGVPLSDAYGLTWAVGGCFEDTITALRLVKSGLTTRFPNVSIVVPHLGGTIPFLWQRLIDSADRDRQRAEIGVGDGQTPPPAPTDALRRLYYDTVNESPVALQCTCQTIGADRLMLGTDFPYLVGPKFKRCVTYVQEAGLKSEDVTAILDTTAQDLLHLPTPAR